VTTYDVTARRWARGWELHISHVGEEVGVTQSRTLSSAERMVRDYLELDDRPDAQDATIAITPDLGGQLAQEAVAARKAVRDAERAQLEAAMKSRLIARQLKAAGLSGADIAAVLKVSAQRVSQLVNSGQDPVPSPRRRTVGRATAKQ
jgi:DNA-directed RNA polymerase specialized sigma subunit